MSDIKDDDIEKRAYAIWEAAGRPEGSHESHWHQAREELLSTTTPKAVKTAKKPEIKVGKSAVKKPAKAAATSETDETVVTPAAIKGRAKKTPAPTANGSLK